MALGGSYSWLSFRWNLVSYSRRPQAKINAVVREIERVR